MKTLYFSIHSLWTGICEISIHLLLGYANNFTPLLTEKLILKSVAIPNGLRGLNECVKDLLFFGYSIGYTDSFIETDKSI